MDADDIRVRRELREHIVRQLQHLTVDEVEFALVPGVAFDRAGNRLGYGKGYYDRLLAMRVERTSAGTKPLVVAVAFDCQLVEQLPVSAHDQAIDLLITPTHRITFTT